MKHSAKKKIEEDRQKKVDAILTAMQECHDENSVTTIDNVLDHIGSVGDLDEVKKSHLRDWCNPKRSSWTPFRIETVKGVKDVIVDTRGEQTTEQEV